MVKFEFDENKSRSNFEKHGIDFYTAQGLWNDSDLIEIPANTSAKILLDQADLGEEVELELQGEQIVIRSAHRARHDWADQFKAMAARGDDALLDGDLMVSTVWDEEEWEW